MAFYVTGYIRVHSFLPCSCRNFADHHAEHEQLQHDLEEAEQNHLGLRQEIENCKRAVSNHRDSVNEYNREQRQAT